MAEGFDLAALKAEIEALTERAYEEAREAKKIVYINPRYHSVDAVRRVLEGTGLAVRESTLLPTDTVVVVDPKFLIPPGVILGKAL